MLAILANPIFRYIAVSLVVFTWAYTKGRSDCAVKQAELRAKAAEQWADKVADVTEKASQRAAEAQQKAFENGRIVEEIVRAASQEIGADDVCLSADVVERLRRLK